MLKLILFYRNTLFENSFTPRVFQSIEITCRVEHNTRYKDRKTVGQTERQTDKERDREKDREATVILNGVLSFVPKKFYESINGIGLPADCLPFTAPTHPSPHFVNSISLLTMLTWLISFFFLSFFYHLLNSRAPCALFNISFLVASVTNPNRKYRETAQRDGNICCHITILQNSYSTHIFGIFLFSALAT